MNKVRVRFAPSPTGFLHIGGLRTALFNWLFARKNKGVFILRIEDTDQFRLVPGSAENIIEALKWYGLDFDEGPIYQSQRLALYKKYSAQLVEQGRGYHCFCSATRLEELRHVQQVNKQPTKYDGLCRNLTAAEVQAKLSARQPHVIRLKVPASGRTEFSDQIYSRIVVDNVNIDDQVLVKSDGYPTYHLANVVDDHDQQITHVIRAEEWLPSTPKHILLYQALGWPCPLFAHLPMVLGPDRSKLSKRHGALPALDYRDQGYLPEAVLNFIALLGWNPKTEREIFSRSELIQEFDLVKVNKSSAIFNNEKLDWMNGQYIKNTPEDELVALSKKFFDDTVSAVEIKKIIRLAKDRMNRLSDVKTAAPFLLEKELSYEPKILIGKGNDRDQALAALEKAAIFIQELPEEKFAVSELTETIKTFITESGLTNQQLLWPLRVALTGLEKSPGVFEVMAALGQTETVRRVKQAVSLLNK